MRDAVAAGVVTAVAVLVRPNTVPLAVIPALLLLSRRDTRIARVLAFAGAVAPAALLIAVLNARWYGSPLKSGYGALDVLYARKNVAPNIRLYAGWFIAAQTPLAFLWLAVACALPERRSERYRLVVVSVIYPAAVLAIYVAYFPWHEWAYLRFLLPAYPVVCAALGAVFVAFAHNVRPARLGVVAVVAVVASLGMQQFRYASDAGVFRMAAGNQRFARAVEFANRLPRARSSSRPPIQGRSGSTPAARCSGGRRYGPTNSTTPSCTCTTVVTYSISSVIHSRRPISRRTLHAPMRRDSSTAFGFQMSVTALSPRI